VSRTVVQGRTGRAPFSRNSGAVFGNADRILHDPWYVQVGEGRIEADAVITSKRSPRSPGARTRMDRALGDERPMGERNDGDESTE
jgi:hypothetical protein